LTDVLGDALGAWGPWVRQVEVRQIDWCEILIMTECSPDSSAQGFVALELPDDLELR